MRERFDVRLDLPFLPVNSEWLKMCEVLDKELPFEKTDINADDMPRRLRIASLGRIPVLMRIVQAAAKIALYDPHEDVGLLQVGEFVLRPDQIMQTLLRLAPGRLRADAENGVELYHRLVWGIRSLESDPDSGATLSGHCSNCRITVAWDRLRELGRCSSCGRPSWTAEPQVALPVGAAAFRAALFRSSPSERAEFRQRLPAQTVGWHEADVLSLLDAVAALHSAPASKSAVDAACSIILGDTGDLIGVMRQRVGSYKVPGGRLSDTAAIARLIGDVERSPSRKTREFLKPLIGAV